MTWLQALLPVLRELGEEKTHRYADSIDARLALVAAAPWRGVRSRCVSVLLASEAVKALVPGKFWVE